jgi:hypothetical protein
MSKYAVKKIGIIERYQEYLPVTEQTPIISLNEDGNGHRGIEVQPKTADGADHWCPWGRRVMGYSAARAMVELSMGVHDSRPPGSPGPMTVPAEYGLGGIAENQIKPGSRMTRSLQQRF